MWVKTEVASTRSKCESGNGSGGSGSVCVARAIGGQRFCLTQPTASLSMSTPWISASRASFGTKWRRRRPQPQPKSRTRFPSQLQSSGTVSRIWCRISSPRRTKISIASSESTQPTRSAYSRGGSGIVCSILLHPPSSDRGIRVRPVCTSLPAGRSKCRTMVHREDPLLIAGIENGLPPELVVGRGQMVFVGGWVFHRRRRIAQLGIRVIGQPVERLIHAMPRADVLREHGDSTVRPAHAYRSGFWGFVPFRPMEGGHGEAIVELVATLSNADVSTRTLGVVELMTGGASEEPPDPVAARA